jgi:hypothetical protein
VSKDKLRSLRGGITYEETDTTGRTFASLFITQGLGNNLGAMDNNSRFASRLGADNRFTKANIDLSGGRQCRNLHSKCFHNADQPDDRQGDYQLERL